MTSAKDNRTAKRESFIKLVHEQLSAVGGIDFPEYARHAPHFSKDSIPAWPDDDMVGAEYETWAE